MPKKVDHEARRLHIAEAVWRIAATRGLEEVSMRQVAGEAGVSTRLVQYYFGTREQLLTDALAYRNARDRQRIEARVPPDASRRLIVREILTGLLPTDAEGRTSALIQFAYGVRAMTDPQLKALFQGYRGPGLPDLIAGLLRDGREAGEVRAGPDLSKEAETLEALTTGLAPDILMGLRSPDEALAVIDYHLDRIFCG